MEFKHYSVLLEESIHALNIKPDGLYIDGTAGGAGHSIRIAQMLESGRLVAIDRDPDAVKEATKRLADYKNASVVQANFAEMKKVLEDLNITDKANGVLLDLGVSSFQLDNPQRGFSYRENAPLDMRMSKSGLTAADVVNTYDEKELVRILREYADEKFAVKIAANIAKYRKTKPIETTNELEEIIKASMPAYAKRDKNPCKRTFQALRIEVNQEFESLKQGLKEAFECLAPKGRLVVITFHSAEDRIVKNTFKELCSGCTCPPDFPICVCGKAPRAFTVGKPVKPSEKELAENRRSQSARLRVLEKL